MIDRYRIHRFLSEDLLEPLYWRWLRLPRPVRRRLESWHYRIIDKGIGRLWCRLLGHLPVMDHCGLPAHDLCAWCSTDMPGQAPRRTSS